MLKWWIAARQSALWPILLLAACSAGAPERPQPTEAESAPSAAKRDAESSLSPLILYDAPLGKPYMQALLGGILRRDGNCVYLAAEGRRWLLALPSPTTRWDAADGTIRFGARLLRFGEEAAFGGGEAGIGNGPEAEAARRAGCDTRNVWWASPEMVRTPLGPPAPAAPPPQRR
ncbi:hypothetical protein [Allosphingosinicella deserti]|nr:hypothetical protein [Sphingomonas deserti]